MDTAAQLAGRDRLDAIVAERLGGAAIDQGPMFSTTGWRTGGAVFAFVGRDGALIVKLPEGRVRELVEAGDGEPMTVGERTRREWVRIPPHREWESLVVQAHAFLAV